MRLFILLLCVLGVFSFVDSAILANALQRSSYLSLRAGGKKISSSGKSTSRGTKRSRHVSKSRQSVVEKYDDEDEDDEDVEEESSDDDNDDDDEEEEEDCSDEEDVGYSDEDKEDDDEDDYIDHLRKSAITNKKRAKRKKPKSMLDLGTDVASDALNMGVKFARGAVKSTVDLAANKHVTEYQVVGKWRFMQEIEVKKGIFISSPASVEFTEDGTVITTCDGQTYESEYVFKERPWPRKCSIYFQARAFQGPKDKEPVNMFYKGHFKRSIMNPNVVLIRGKVFKLAGKMFWKQQLKAGTFKATKRKYG